MALLLQNGGDAGDIVVIDEAEKMLAFIKRPVLRAELPVERIGNFKEIQLV